MLLFSLFFFALWARFANTLSTDNPSAVVTDEDTLFNATTGVDYNIAKLISRGHNTVYIRLGTKRQHIGTKTGQDLRDDLYHRCFNRNCNYSKKLDQIVCRRPEYNHCDVAKGVQYLCENGSRTCTDAHLFVRIVRYNFPRGYPGIEQALFELIAGAVKAEGDHASGAFAWRVHGKIYHWHSIGNFVGVFEDKSGAYMDVKINFNGKTTMGQFFCDLIKQPVVGFMDAAVRKDFEEATRTSYGTHVQCDDFTGTENAELGLVKVGGGGTEDPEVMDDDGNTPLTLEEWLATPPA